MWEYWASINTAEGFEFDNPYAGEMLFRACAEVLDLLQIVTEVEAGLKGGAA
jgi:hypothetical protein